MLHLFISFLALCTAFTIYTLRPPNRARDFPGAHRNAALPRLTSSLRLLLLLIRNGGRLGKKKKKAAVLSIMTCRLLFCFYVLSPKLVVDRLSHLLSFYRFCRHAARLPCLPYLPRRAVVFSRALLGFDSLPGPSS